MGLISHGVDIIECRRVARVLELHGERFLDRVFTAGERRRAAEMNHQIPHLAGRFAAKEAVLKVLGTGWRGRYAWTDIDISNDALGRPEVTLSGACAERAAELGITSILISISHTRESAIASAMGLGTGSDL